jgi:hypothetical protein
MTRSKENWAAFFKRSDRKKVTKRKSASLLSTVGGVVEPHVIGELISVPENPFRCDAARPKRHKSMS